MKNIDSYVIGIDASRNRSGGARNHLIGIIDCLIPEKFGISKVYIWSYKSLLDSIPNRPWLKKICPAELENSLLSQLYWQRVKLPKSAKKLGINLILNTDAGTVCRFTPCVTMSRDMLSYEPGEIERYGFSLSRIRLIVLRYIQNNSLRKSSAVIFLTNYAANTIQKSSGIIRNFAIIPHGVSSTFNNIKPKDTTQLDITGQINCLYISNADLYKHQWHVIKAIEILREEGFKVSLELVGGGNGKAQKKIEHQISISDPEKQIIKQYKFLPHKELPQFLSSADLFIFASSCENMPNTLIEAMAAGLPIACSNRGPMPEVLQDGGVYFNPENPNSIAVSIKDLILDTNKRRLKALRAKELSMQYSWDRCSSETFNYIRNTLNHYV